MDLLKKIIKLLVKPRYFHLMSNSIKLNNQFFFIKYIICKVLMKSKHFSIENATDVASSQRLLINYYNCCR